MHTHLPQQKNDNEIDLVEVVKTLWKNKWTVILTTALSGIIAFIILLFISPVYQLQVTLKPPLFSQVAALDFSVLPENNAQLTSLNPSEVFALFYENMVSETTRQQFFTQIYWPEIATDAPEKISKHTAYKQFNHHLKVHKDPKKIVFDVTIKGHNPEQLMKWFTQFVETAEKISKSQIDKNLKTQVALKTEQLQTKIDMARSLAKQARQDRLLQLEEAVQVASAVDQEPNKWIILNQAGGMNDSNTQYLLGAQALKREIDNLKKRQSDDPFIPNLRTLSLTLDFYEHFKPAFEMISLYRLDGELSLPQSPVAPKRALLSVLALVLGFLLGCVLVFFRVWFNSK